MQKKDIYLASPGFSEEERSLLIRYEGALESCGYSVFSPFRDAKGDMSTPKGRRQIFDSNKSAILHCDYMLANLDWTTINGKNPFAVPDQGTIWEVGLASGLKEQAGKLGTPKVIGVTSDPDHGINIMLFFGVDGFVAGVDRFLEALEKHKSLDIFINKFDQPNTKSYYLY